MNNIDNIIKDVIKNDIEIPTYIENRIEYTLENKKQNKKVKRSFAKRFITFVIAIITTFLGTFCVYALTGGKINETPIKEWLGIKFSNKYVDYKKPVENQVIKFKETSLELTSTLCSEGITILEFDLKLSEDDYNTLKIDQSLISDAFIQAQEDLKADSRARAIEILIRDKGYKKDEEIPEEVINEEAKNFIKLMDEQTEEKRKTTYIPALSLNYDQKAGTRYYDKFNPNVEWYSSLYIDDEPYGVRNYQKIEKVSQYEYKIYIMYFISDKELNGKTDFKITLKNNKIVNYENGPFLKQYGVISRCEFLASDRENKGNIKIDLPEEFEVNVSKNDILNDSLILENLNLKSEFRNITQSVEKVVVTPFQTIVRIKHSASNQSSNAFQNRYEDPNIEYLPYTRIYKAYDANGKELSCFGVLERNTLIYSDGTEKDVIEGPFQEDYNNCVYETIKNLMIENTDSDYIKIVPVEIVRNPVNGEEETGEIPYEMEPLIINLK